MSAITKGPKLSFGLRMWALKKARQLLKKEQTKLDEMHQPITPLDSHIEKTLLVPQEVTEPVKLINTVVVKSISPIDRALQHLREQATKL